MEQCYGCGAKAEKHSVVGIINRADVDLVGTQVISNPDNASPFIGVHVCKGCHENPELRTEHALKCHFVMATDTKRVAVALMLAGSSDIGG